MLKEYFSYKKLSLKTRIILLFLLSFLIPFTFIGIISYHTIHSIVNNQIQKGLQGNLKQDTVALENTFNNLNHLSQQLSFEGTVGKKLHALLSTDVHYERKEITGDIISELNVIDFTNPSVGLIMYYFEDANWIEFENLPVKKGFSLEILPLLQRYYGISYYGPHISNYQFSNQYVISAIRQVNLPNRDDVLVYVEGAFNLTKVFDDKGNGKDASYLFLDESGRITFTQKPNIFPVYSFNESINNGESHGKVEGYYWFKQTSSQGWSIVSLISEADYNKEINQWFFQVFLFFLFFLAVSFFLAWLLWKMVYRPLKEFHLEIGMLANNEGGSNYSSTNIPEFDLLLTKFRQMKQQIWDLVGQIEDNGKGMSKETIELLLNNKHSEQQKMGMGIGLNYVKRMLETHYDGKAEFKIVGVVGQGTTIYLNLPYKGGNENEESTDCRR